MPEYRIIKLHCIGDDKRGYEVNGASDTGMKCEFTDEAATGDILNAMVECGYLDNRPSRTTLDFEFGDRDITITLRRNGRYLWELRQV